MRHRKLNAVRALYKQKKPSLNWAMLVSEGALLSVQTQRL